MENVRTLAWCLAVGLLQMLLLGVWLWQSAARAPWWLWLASALVLAASALLCALGAARLHRLLLWRRRRSERPSRAVQAERRRISGDLHDGVGALLVNAIALLQPQDARDRQVQGLLEQALLDLRLMVDSMDAMDDVLTVRLARLRHRLQPVLERRGMQMHWQVAELQAGGDAGGAPGLPRGAAAHHLLAIAQEAVSNALQHAQARSLWLVLAPLDGSEGRQGPAGWELRIEDDGCGIAHRHGEVPGTPPSRGMGLDSMHRRALSMGATLQVRPRQGGGTCVCVQWSGPQQAQAGAPR